MSHYEQDQFFTHSELDEMKGKHFTAERDHEATTGEAVKAGMTAVTARSYDRPTIYDGRDSELHLLGITWTGPNGQEVYAGYDRQDLSANVEDRKLTLQERAAEVRQQKGQQQGTPVQEREREEDRER